MNCLFLCSDIDWAATGSMLGGIGSIVSVLLLVFVHFFHTEKLRKSEESNVEKERRINLFNKRYEVYDLFSRFYRTCKEFLEKIKIARGKEEFELSEEDIRDFLKETICSDSSNLEGIYARKVYLNYFKKNDSKDFDKEKQKELFDKFVLVDEKFMKDSLTKMKMAKFVFSEPVSSIVEEFAEILLDKYSYKESGSEDYEKADYENHNLTRVFMNKLGEVMKKIENQQIVEKMGNEINIQFNE